jgi:hypothetical protein
MYNMDNLIISLTDEFRVLRYSIKIMYPPTEIDCSS